MTHVSIYICAIDVQRFKLSPKNTCYPGNWLENLAFSLHSVACTSQNREGSNHMKNIEVLHNMFAHFKTQMEDK